MSVRGVSTGRLRHARSALRRAAADLRHAAGELRKVAVDLRNAGLEIARAIYAVLLAGLPATAEVALRAAGARTRLRRRRPVIAQGEADLRPLPRVVVPVESRGTATPRTEDGRVGSTLLLVLGAGPEQLSGIVAEVERLAATVDLRPVIVTDSDAFGVFREGGWLFEYLPPREEWERLEPDATGYDAFVRARVGELEAIYRPARIVTLERPEHLGRLGGLLAGPPGSRGVG